MTGVSIYVGKTPHSGKAQDLEQMTKI